jgi:hypothetical protein
MSLKNLLVNVSGTMFKSRGLSPYRRFSRDASPGPSDFVRSSQSLMTKRRLIVNGLSVGPGRGQEIPLEVSAREVSSRIFSLRNVLGDEILQVQSGSSGSSGVSRFEILDDDTEAAVLLTQASGVNVWQFRGQSTFLDRVFIESPNSVPVDADLNASSLTMYLNEATNTLHIRIKYSDGVTLKTGSVALV